MYHPFEKMTCAFLPQIPNVRIKLFKLPDYYNARNSEKKIRKTNEYKKISTIIDHESSNHETSICLMLFSNWCGYPMLTNWVSVIKKRYNLNLIQAIIHI